jgi:membrane associated rhomboid family serine protease
MPSNGPTTLTLPPFAGTVRRLVFLNIGVFFAVEILLWLAPGAGGWAVSNLVLEPYAVVHGEVWQLITYCFLHLGLLDILFAMLTLWFFGSLLQGAYGSRWLAELYFTSAIGGALLAIALSFTRVLHLSPESFAGGAWAALFGVMIAVAVRMGDQEFLLWFLVRIRAKYMVALYILVDLAILLRNEDAFAALLNLSGALCGYLYTLYAPRRGMGYGFSEQLYGMRNAYYRAKRRRAAKKFEVYMGKQGREVRFDKEGRYVDPDEERKDPKDRRWMN